MAVTFKEKARKFLIVDTSYIFHARIASAFNNYMDVFGDLPYPKEYIHTYDWTTNDEFMNMLNISANTTFKDLISKSKISPKYVILAVDCSRKNIWRKKIYQTYKDNRDVTPEEQEGQPNFSQVWAYIRGTLMDVIAHKQGCKVLSNNYCEGDDIIAITKSFIRENYGLDAAIHICASDSDLTQLHDENLFIQDLFGKDVIKSTKAKYRIEDLSLLPRIKEIAGDKKDNVPQAFESIGPVKALKMMNDPDEYAKQLAKNPGAPAIVKVNRILLDLNCIPKFLVESVKKELTTHFDIQPSALV